DATAEVLSGQRSREKTADFGARRRKPPRLRFSCSGAPPTRAEARINSIRSHSAPNIDRKKGKNLIRVTKNLNAAMSAAKSQLQDGASKSMFGLALMGQGHAAQPS